MCLKNLNHDYDFNYTKSKIDKELSVLNQGLELFQKMNNQKVLLNHVQDDYAKEQSLLEQIETELKAYQEQFRLLKEEYHEKFLSWNESNQILKMDASTMKIFFEIISDYGNSERYYEIDQDIHNRYVWYLKNQTETVSRLSIEIKQFMNELKKIQEQYEYWNDLKDPQPDIVKEQEEARHYLEGKNIPFIPMYTLLDFDDSLSQDEKNNIEEQLLSSGLMTALIIPDIYQKEVLNLPKGMKESFLFTHNKIENLTVYILHSKIEYNSLCKAFGLNEGSVKFFDNGLEIGNICSVISQTRQSIFIGKASREAYRKSQLDKLQEDIHIKEQDIQELENNLKIAQDKVKVLEKEYARVTDWCIVGNMTMIKRCAWAIEAFRQVPNSQLTIYGNLPDGYSQKDLPSNVHYAGFLEEVPYEKHQGYLSCSMSECFANAAVEASAKGLVCLLSDTDLAHRYYKSQSKGVITFGDIGELILWLNTYQKEGHYASATFAKAYQKKETIKVYKDVLSLEQ